MLEAQPLQVVLLAGGRGTRMFPHTREIPKVLLPVGGHPFLEWLLRLYEGQGVSTIHLCLGHHADAVLEFLAQRPRSAIQITWTVEETPLGTAGCLRLAQRFLEPQFAVAVGDSYLPESIVGLWGKWLRTGEPAAMAVLRTDDELVDQNVAVNDGKVVAYRKGGTGFRYVDYGITFLQRYQIQCSLACGPADLSSIYSTLISARRLAALTVDRRFYEIGSPSGYSEILELVASGRLRIPEGPQRIAGGLGDA